MIFSARSGHRSTDGAARRYWDVGSPHSCTWRKNGIEAAFRCFLRAPLHFVFHHFAWILQFASSTRWSQLSEAPDKTGPETGPGSALCPPAGRVKESAAITETKKTA